ncbi:MAG: carbohydrate binding domain-containing protein [Candidatus Daviesbacteria bacterium]
MWKMFIKKTLIDKQSGQSLLEVVIAIMVGVIVVGALTALILYSLKNAQFAQNQAKATKYAQEAIEKVKTIRDRDEDGSIVFKEENLKFSDLWAISMSEVANCANQSGNCYFFLDQSTFPISLKEKSGTPNYESLENGFTRQIILTDISTSYATEKKLIVKVVWKDSSGDHESNLQTVLTSLIEPTSTPTPTSVSTPTPVLPTATPTTALPTPTPTPTPLIANGGFESQLTSWNCRGNTDASTGSCSADSNIKYSGTYSGKVDYLSISNPLLAWGWQLSQSIAGIQRGCTYTLSAYVKKDLSDTLATIALQETVSPYRGQSISAPNNTNWNPLSFTYTIPNDWGLPVQVFLRVGNVPRTAWFDDVLLTRGACL